MGKEWINWRCGEQRRHERSGKQYPTNFLPLTNRVSFIFFFFFWTVIHRWSIVVVAIAADCYFRRVNIASWMTRSKSSIEIANEETWPLIIFGRKHIRVVRYVLHVKIYTDSFFRIEERKKKIKKKKERGTIQCG